MFIKLASSVANFIDFAWYKNIETPFFGTQNFENFPVEDHQTNSFLWGLGKEELNTPKFE